MHTKPLCSFIFGREINMVCRSHRKYSVCCQILSGALRGVWYLVNTVTIEILVFSFCAGVVHTYQIIIFLFCLLLSPSRPSSLPLFLVSFLSHPFLPLFCYPSGGGAGLASSMSLRTIMNWNADPLLSLCPALRTTLFPVRAHTLV